MIVEGAAKLRRDARLRLDGKNDAAAATVDLLFGFAAVTDAVADRHFDQLFAAYLEDDRVRDFMREANPSALHEMAARFAEAIRRRLWTPRANRAADLLAECLSAPKDAA